MVVNGWTLLFHEAILGQLQRLADADRRARKAAPRHFRTNANVKLLAALAKLMLEVIPADPGRPEYRQGNTLGEDYRHWFRAKFFGRFRLFFRYDSRSRLIVYAWVNDERSLRQRGAKSDPYEVFRRMLGAGNPPNDWAALMKSSSEAPGSVLPGHSMTERRRVRVGAPEIFRQFPTPVLRSCCNENGGAAAAGVVAAVLHSCCIGNNLGRWSEGPALQIARFAVWPALTDIRQCRISCRAPHLDHRR
jgi:toxin YhaV